MSAEVPREAYPKSVRSSYNASNVLHVVLVQIQMLAATVGAAGIVPFEELMQFCAEAEDANAWPAIAALRFKDIELQDNAMYALLGPSKGTIYSQVSHPLVPP